MQCSHCKGAFLAANGLSLSANKPVIMINQTVDGKHASRKINRAEMEKPLK